MGRIDEANGGSPLDTPLAERETAVIIRKVGSQPNLDEQQKTSVLPEILACVSANSFHLALGLSLSYSAILLPQLESKDSDIEVSPTAHSPWIASAAPLAVTSGSLLTGLISNLLGRITTVRLATIPYCIGWGIIATATGVPALIVGRFLTGLAAGTIGTNPGIVYTTEVARPEWRGSLISTAPFMVSLGTMLVYLLGALFSWRTVAWVCFSAPIVPLVTTLLWSPESPHWLAEHGKGKALEKAVKFLTRRDKNANPTLKAENMIEEANQRKANNKSRRHSNDNFCTNFLKIAGQRTVLRPLLLLTALFFLQQFSGIYVVQFYAVTMFEEIGSAMEPKYASVVVGGLRVILSVVAIALLRWFPRRPLMVISALGMILSMSIAGHYANVSDSGKIKLDLIHGSLATASLLLFVTFSMIGVLTIPWTMTAELFPSEVRAYGQGTIIAIANAFMFASVQTYRLLEVALGSVARVMWLYSGVAALFIVVVVLFSPETHGRSLAAIEEYFRTSWFYPGHERRRARANIDATIYGSGKRNGERYLVVPLEEKNSPPT